MRPRSVSIFFLLPLLLTIPLLPARADASAFRAGAAKREIVPPFPTRMGGFFDRTDTFTGVLDPIYARALVCFDGDTKVAVVSTDLVNVSENLVADARKAIEGQTGIPQENILVAASHSHSGPSGYQGTSLLGVSPHEELLEFMVGEITDAVVEAHANLEPARIGHRTGLLQDASRNRQQNNNEVVDPEVNVVKLWKTDSREIIAILFNFTAHPVIMGGSNLELSGEYPGAAQRTVESVLGGVALFTQGAAGDVTIHRSGSPREEIKRVGRTLAGEVIKTAGLIQADDADKKLASSFNRVRVGARDIPGPEQAAATLDELGKKVEEAKAKGIEGKELRDLERAADSAETTAFLSKFVASAPGTMDRVTDASVHVIKLGPLLLVGVPGELFVEYALEMKDRTRQTLDRPMALVGYANGYVGYIVTPRAVRTGGYEQAISLVDETAGRTLTEEAMRLAGEIVE